MSSNQIESIVTKVISWKVYFIVSISITTLPLTVVLASQQPFESFIKSAIALNLMFLFAVFPTNIFFRWTDKKYNFILEFNDSALHVLRSNKRETYSYDVLNYRVEPPLIEDNGELKYLHIEDPDFNEVSESITILDNFDNEIVTCDPSFIKDYEKLLDQLSKISPWSPEQSKLNSAVTFEYKKIPIISTYFFIFLYFTSISILLVNYPSFGLLTNFVLFFLLDSLLFGMLIFLSYGASKPSVLFPISFFKAGILFNNTRSIIPWEKLDVYYHGLNTTKLRIRYQGKSLDLNPTWVKNYSKFVKTLNPYLKYSKHRKEQLTKSFIKKSLVKMLKNHIVFFSLSLLLLIFSTALFIAIPVINSFNNNYSDQLTFQDPETVVESFNLSSSIQFTKYWSLNFSLVGNLAAYEILWGFQTEYKFFSNYTTGQIDYRMRLFVNNDLEPVISRSSYSIIHLVNDSQTYWGWSKYEQEINTDVFKQGNNQIVFSVELYSDYTPSNEELGHFQWNTSGLTLTFNALDTGDGIPETAKLFPSCNAYLLEFLTFFSLLPLLVAVDMHFQKPRII